MKEGDKAILKQRILAHYWGELTTEELLNYIAELIEKTGSDEDDNTRNSVDSIYSPLPQFQRDIVRDGNAKR